MQTFRTVKEEVYHIDFNVEYPNYNISSLDEVSCSVAIIPKFENEAQKEEIDDWYVVFYENGKKTEYTRVLSDSVGFITKRFKRDELIVDNENYVAVPKTGTWQVGLSFKVKKKDGTTKKVANDIVKNIEFKYDTKPSIYIFQYGTNPYCPNFHLHSGDYTEHYFSVWGRSHNLGVFWLKKEGITSSTDKGCFPLRLRFFDLDSAGLDIYLDTDYQHYTNDNIPSHAVLQHLDVNGKVIESNIIPIQTDEHGCAIDVGYTEQEEYFNTHPRWNFSY